jgi:hypothetical protein
MKESVNKVNKIKKEKCAPFSDLIKVAAYKAGLRTKTIQKAYDAIYEYIIEEMQLREVVYLKGIGYFGAIPVGGYDKLMPETFGSTNMVYKYVPPQYKIRFSPTPKFIDEVNTCVGEEKEEIHKRGQLIDKHSDLKEQRRAAVKTMLRDEGHKLHDPKYADSVIETFRAGEFNEEDTEEE